MMGGRGEGWKWWKGDDRVMKDIVSRRWIDRAAGMVDSGRSRCARVSRQNVIISNSMNSTGSSVGRMDLSI